MGLLGKLMGKAQDTLNDPQKMDAIRGKVTNALNRRMARGSGGGYYAGGMNPGMGGYADGSNESGNTQDPRSGNWDSGTSDGSGGWDTSASSDSGGWGTCPR